MESLKTKPKQSSAKSKKRSGYNWRTKKIRDFYHSRHMGRTKEAKKMKGRCLRCGNRFHPAILKRHDTLRVTCNRGQKCDECHKIFVSAGSLSIHKNTHNGSRPYQCAHCDKRYANPGTLYEHNQAVHLKRRFQCHLCTASYCSASGRKNHMETCIHIVFCNVQSTRF